MLYFCKNFKQKQKGNNDLRKENINLI